MAGIPELVPKSTECFVMAQILDKFALDILAKNVSLIINAELMEDCIFLDAFNHFQGAIARDEVRFHIHLRNNKA